jgi:Spy/CpxP family protein refolding chaperone
MHQLYLLNLKHFKTHNYAMNVQRFLFLPGALAIALSYAVPMLPVAAQTPTPPAGQYQKRGVNLNLTEAQKAQLKQIRESARSQIDAILTPEQKAQLDAAKQQRQQRQPGEQGQSRQQGQKPRGKWAALNLTADQKARIQAVRQDAKQKMNAVLTAEQRQQLEQRRQQRPQKRQQPS